MGSPFSTQHSVSGEGAEICFKDLLQAVGSQLFRADEHFQPNNIGEQETLPQAMPSIQNCPRLCYFPPNIVVPRTTILHLSRPYTLQQPFAHTASYLYSFIPDSIRRWNYLPEDVVCTPTLAKFNNSLRLFT